MKVDAWVITDSGLRRESNQDSYFIDKSRGIFVVADGMGGHSGGEVASSLAVQSVQDVLTQDEALQKSPREILMKAYEIANHRIHEKASKEQPELAGMGTTMVMAYIRSNTVYIANVGDSRCYLFRKPFLWQLTEDHSLINEQVRAGLLSEDQAHAMVGRNVITRSVGYESEVYPDIIERQMHPGEIFILCSDGLTSMVEDEKISEILNKNNPDIALRGLLDQALANGGDDNITILVFQIQ